MIIGNIQGRHITHMVDSKELKLERANNYYIWAIQQEKGNECQELQARLAKRSQKRVEHINKI